MSARITRLAHLAAELEEAGVALGHAATSGAALVFLDRLARCEAFLASEKRAASVEEVLAAALQARDTERVALAELAAAGLDLESLRTRAEALDDASVDAVSFGWDCLLVAAVTPFLGAFQTRTFEALEHVSAALYARRNPVPELRAVALDRAQHERPERMRNGVLAELLDLLGRSDERESADSGTTRTLDDVLARLPPALRARAREPIRSSGAEVVGLFRRAADARNRPMALAAAAHRTPDQVLLRRHALGEFVLERVAASVNLCWFGSGTPTVAANGMPLPQQLQGAAVRWPVPEALGTLEARLGPERLLLTLPLDTTAGAPGLANDLDEARDWVAFAPRSVARRLKQLREDPRATGVLKGAIETYLLALRERADRVADRYTCAFPVLVTGRSPSWMTGAVLHATVPEVSGLQRSTAEPLRSAFRDATAASALFDNPVVSVLPRRSNAEVPLEGDSFGAAALLAQEAWRRGVPVPGEIVASAAVEQGADGGLYLRAVSGCDRKRQLLEVERPGCTFFCVAPQGEVVELSETIRVVRLEEGPIAPLIAAVFGTAAASPDPEHWQTLAQRADRAYRAQQPAARRLYEELLAGANNAQLEFLATLRLGGSALHEGRPEEAAALLDRAAALAPEEASHVEVVELQTTLARTHLDRLHANEAQQILVPLLEQWGTRLEKRGETFERRMLLISILGSMRSLRLLQGRAPEAVQLQEQLVGWAPATELARSLGDYADSLRRAACFVEAQAALEEAFAALQKIPIASYRQQTEAFLLFFHVRLCVDTAQPIARRTRLHEVSSLALNPAARWRTDVGLLVDALQTGSRDSVERVPTDVQGSPVRNWYTGVELLRLARAGYEPRVLRSAAATFLRASGLHPDEPTHAAALSSVLVVSGNDEGAEVTLLRHAAY